MKSIFSTGKQKNDQFRNVCLNPLFLPSFLLTYSFTSFISLSLSLTPFRYHLYLISPGSELLELALELTLAPRKHVLLGGQV